MLNKQIVRKLQDAIKNFDNLISRYDDIEKDEIRLNMRNFITYINIYDIRLNVSPGEFKNFKKSLNSLGPECGTTMCLIGYAAYKNIGINFIDEYWRAKDIHTFENYAQTVFASRERRVSRAPLWPGRRLCWDDG